MLTANSKFEDVVTWAISFIDSLIPVLAALALVIFFIGIVRFIYRSGDAHGKHADKQFILWGLVVLFVLFSVWGILRVLHNSFLGGSGSASPQLTPGTNPNYPLGPLY